MKKSGRTFVIIELLLAAFAILCIVMMVRSRSTPEKKKIAVIVEDSENDMWTPMKDGMREAGKEQNVDIRFVTTGTFDDADDEIKSLDDAVSDGCDGVLIYPISERTVKLIKKKSYRIPIMLIIGVTGYDMEGISIDAESVGRKLAEMIIEDNGDGRTIGIISGKRDDRTASLIKQGLDADLEGHGYTEIFFRRGANESFIRKNKPDVLVCLDENAISTAAQLVGEKRLSGVNVYGCGFSQKDIYQLDMENIRGLEYLDVFRIGYYGVTEMAGRMHGSLSKTYSRVIADRAIRKQDIFKDNGILNTFSRKR